VVDHQRDAPVLHALVARSLRSRHHLPIANLAVAHRPDRLAVEPAGRREVFAHRFGAALTQAEVVAHASRRIGESFDGDDRPRVVLLHHGGEPVEYRAIDFAELAARELEVHRHVELEHGLHLLHAHLVLAPKRLQLLLERIEAARVIGHRLIGRVDPAGNLPVARLHLLAQLGDFGVELFPLDSRGASGQTQRHAHRAERGHGPHTAMPCEHGDLPATGWKRTLLQLRSWGHAGAVI